MRVLAIDPGSEQSAYVLYDPHTSTVIRKGIVPNEQLETWLGPMHMQTHCVIEMIASYGMPIGAEVFETVYWIGRFAARWDHYQIPATRLFRREVKLHLCNSARAKDSNIRQALIDRFGGSKRAAIGLKASPGPLYGFKSDMWAALGVAVTYADTHADDALALVQA